MSIFTDPDDQIGYAYTALYRTHVDHEARPNFPDSWPKHYLDDAAVTHLTDAGHLKETPNGFQLTTKGVNFWKAYIADWFAGKRTERQLAKKLERYQHSVRVAKPKIVPTFIPTFAYQQPAHLFGFLNVPMQEEALVLDLLNQIGGVCKISDYPILNKYGGKRTFTRLIEKNLIKGIGSKSKHGIIEILPAGESYLAGLMRQSA